MYERAASGEVEMCEEVLKSWFVLGRLGGFNTMNLQVQKLRLMLCSNRFSSVQAQNSCKPPDNTPSFRNILVCQMTFRHMHRTHVHS